jgi:hypothetical protein
MLSRSISFDGDLGQCIILDRHVLILGYRIALDHVPVLTTSPVLGALLR